MSEVLDILQAILRERQLMYDRVAHAPTSTVSPDEVSQAWIALLEDQLEVARHKEAHNA